MENGKEFFGYRKELILVLEKRSHHSKPAKCLIPHGVSTSCVENARTNHSRQVSKIHFAARFGIQMGKGGNPFEKNE